MTDGAKAVAAAVDEVLRESPDATTAQLGLQLWETMLGLRPITAAVADGEIMVGTGVLVAFTAGMTYERRSRR